MTEREVSSERLPEYCPHCDRNWIYHPPAIVAGTDKVRCIECKTVFDFPVSSERVSEEKLDGWLIHKAGRGWYRPAAQGYTNDPLQAGRYSHEEALSYSHPNGWGGPRDGITIKHESELLALRSSVKTVGVPEAMELLRKALAADAQNQSRRNEMLATLIVNLEKAEPTAELAVALRDFVRRERPKLSAIEALSSEQEVVAVPDELTARYWNMLPPGVDAICEPVPGTATHHLKWMLQELRTMGDSHKAMRWLGFVQGVLIMNGYTTVQAEREFTRPYLSAPTPQEAPSEVTDEMVQKAWEAYDAKSGYSKPERFRAALAAALKGDR